MSEAIINILTYAGAFVIILLAMGIIALIIDKLIKAGQWLLADYRRTIAAFFISIWLGTMAYSLILRIL